MANRRFELTYGEQSRAFELPAECLAGEPIVPRKTEPLEGGVPKILQQALSKPVGRPRLAEMAAGKFTVIDKGNKLLVTRAG